MGRSLGRARTLEPGWLHEKKAMGGSLGRARTRTRARTDNDDDDNDDDDNDDDDDDYDDGDDNDGDDDHDDHDDVRWWEVERGHMSDNFPSYKLTSANRCFGKPKLLTMPRLCACVFQLLVASLLMISSGFMTSSAAAGGPADCSRWSG